MPGLWFKDVEGNSKRSKPAKMLENLDINLPGQAWELIDLKKYSTIGIHLTILKVETNMPLTN